MCYGKARRVMLDDSDLIRDFLVAKARTLIRMCSRERRDGRVFFGVRRSGLQCPTYLPPANPKLILAPYEQ